MTQETDSRWHSFYAVMCVRGREAPHCLPSDLKETQLSVSSRLGKIGVGDRALALPAGEPVLEQCPQLRRLPYRRPVAEGARTSIMLWIRARLSARGRLERGRFSAPPASRSPPHSVAGSPVRIAWSRTPNKSAPAHGIAVVRRRPPARLSLAAPGPSGGKSVPPNLSRVAWRPSRGSVQAMGVDVRLG